VVSAPHGQIRFCRAGTVKRIFFYFNQWGCRPAQFIYSEFPLVPMLILAPQGLEDQFPVVSSGKTRYQQFISK
jgi:hypothetical protein